MKITVIRKDGTKKRRDVKVGSSFVDSIQQRASFDSVYWWKVFVGGVEVQPDTCPKLIEDGMDILLAHEDIDVTGIV